MSKSYECHACGQKMVRDVRPDTVEYKGTTVEIEQPGWYCTTCDEAVFEGEDAAVAEDAFVRLKTDVDGILVSEEVRRIREKLKLSQRAAGKLLGGGPRSFQKYESGTVWVTRPMANLLRLLDNEPERLREIRPRGSHPRDQSSRASGAR